MESSIKEKDSAAGGEEPIKSESPVQNPDGSDRSDGAVSPPPNCSICLGKLVNTSFTDSCLHQFCFTCLLQWSKIKKVCPLCKQTFKSIIHNVRSEEDYDQYHVPRELARREQLPNIAPQVPIEERLHRLTNPADYRRTIYTLGIWATALPGVFGRFRGCSADFYRREPRELNRLMPWLNRELQVLLNHNAPHVAYVMRVILEGLSQYDIRSSEFRDLIRPFFGIFTDHFVHEFLNYARTNFDLVGYDESVTYLPHELMNEYLSNDSDVRVLDAAIDLRMNPEMPNAERHTVSMPGPSTVEQTFELNDVTYQPLDVLIITSDSSPSDSSDDVQVIGCVKGRSNRTPEIIELSSSDSENINITHVSTTNAPTPTEPVLYEDNAQPSTSYSVKKRKLSSSSSESDSDSEFRFTCRRYRKYQSPIRKHMKRSTTPKRRNRSSERRIRKRSSRHLCSSVEDEIIKKRNKGSTQRVTKRRLSSTSSSSDSSSHETDSKSVGEKKSRSSHYLKKGSSLRIRSKQASDTKESYRKELRYKDDRQSRNNLISSHTPRKEKKSTFKRRESQIDTSDEERSWINMVALKTRDVKAPHSREVIVTSSDSEEEFSSHSTSSDCSNKSYTYKKKSRHRDRHKSEKRK